MALKGVQKIAVLLAVLGEEAASRVMAAFQPEEQERIGQAMIEMEESELPDEDIQAVIEEFKGLMGSGALLRSRMGKTLHGVLEAVYGDDEGARRFEEIRELSRSRFPFLALLGVRSADLAQILQQEHPQVRALVLANLDPDQSAEILEIFPEEERTALVIRMASMEEPPPRLLKQIARQMLERTQALPRQEKAGGGTLDPRLRTVADILNASSPGADKEILERLEEDDHGMVAKIRESMFSWNDLTMIDRRTMQKILAGIDTKVLAVALKGCEESVTEAILGATSQRTRDMIMEEKELIGAVPTVEALTAQRQVLNAVRELMETGEITVSRAASGAMVS